MADSKQKDVVTSDVAGDAYPEGTHPARPASEVTHAADKVQYKDAPDELKPDPSSIVQIEVLPKDRQADAEAKS